MKLTKSSRLNAMLFDMGIHNQFDVVFHLPKRYENLTPTTQEKYDDKQRIVAFGTIVSALTSINKPHLFISTFDFMSEDHKFFKVVCYNRPYFNSQYSLNDQATIVGSYDLKNKRINLINIYKGRIPSEQYFKPIYQLPNGYQNHLYASLVKRCLNEIKDRIYNDVPSNLRKKYGLIEKKQAIENVHFPKCIDDIKAGLKYLKYEEALFFSLKTQLIKKENQSLAKIKKEPIDIDICTPFIDNLPFKLTNDQYVASQEIIADMNKSSLMYRLLQGDVGSGKTIVSFLALYANYLRHDQGALMAPTDALARQHFQNAYQLFSKLGVNVALLVGSTPSSEKKQILNDLKDGIIDILIGTHALFSKNVIYNSLGLAVIDEQHRFGVNQRLLLASKGDNADLLMMSATPIPRSLALSIYGDLDISTLISFPSQQKKIITKVVKSDNQKIFDGINYILNQNRQVYIVAPLIDYSENKRYSIDSLSAKYILKYPNRVGILHGKMKQEEKEDVLKRFYLGEISILVTTLVIEVGIDVKKASMMVIYDASSFGLASLHQLRGRIGRDGYPSYCFLTYDGDDEEELKKLEVLQKTQDGFVIAEEDLKLRGPGELSGIRQSGMPDFNFLNVYNDIKIFQLARDDAKNILNDSNNPLYSWVLTKAKKMIDTDDFKNA